MIRAKLSALALILITSLIYYASGYSGIDLLAAAPGETYLPAPLVTTTDTKFTHQIIEVGDQTSFDTITQIDPDKDACSEPDIKQPGQPGKNTQEIMITYYDGQEYDRHVVATHIQPPVDQIIVKGSRKHYQTMQTDSGSITYWCRLGTFSATAYDSTCAGCKHTTAIGLKTGFGVVAVDRSVIPLGSQLYITGYGKAIAGDTGGSIRGNRIDLGFDSIGAWWGRRDVEVYLL